MSFDILNFWQKHTLGSLKHTYEHSLPSLIFALDYVNTSSVLGHTA